MLRISIVICFILSSLGAISQTIQTVLNPPFSRQYDPIQEPILTVKELASSITSAELRDHLMVIASDEFEGRETGMPGQKKAAEYIANYFKELGIEPYDGESYFQEFPLKRRKYTSTTVSVNGQEFSFIDDFYFFGTSVNTSWNEEEIILAGYGIEQTGWNDYNVDVTGKTVMILTDVPRNKAGESILTGSGADEWVYDWNKKVELAKEKGVSKLIMVNQNYDTYLSRVKYYLENPGMSLDSNTEEDERTIEVLFISPEMANSVLASSKNKNLKKYKKRISKSKPAKVSPFSVSFSLNLNQELETFTGENVLAYIPGTDLADELVVITAHYDHIGMKGEDINNGADDDGSGTVSALEIAEAFMLAVNAGMGPRRSVLIMTVSGEEKGLLGSRYYSDNPIYPLENTVSNLNIDMIGRVDEAHADNPNYVYLIGSDKLSTDLHNISEETNAAYTKLDLDYTYNDPNDPNKFYYRSDHYNFAKHGIPVIFYFSGVHEDYHKPTDTPDKILYEKLETIAQLVFYTAWELANRNDAPVVDKVNEFEE